MSLIGVAVGRRLYGRRNKYGQSPIAKQVNMQNQELVNYIFDKIDHSIVSKFKDWINSSQRFRDFAEIYKDKIKGNNKVGGALKDKQNCDEKLEDILFELEVAYLLLQNDYFSIVEYEKDKKLGPAPDFTITCKCEVAFNLEVKHIRKSELEKRFKAWEIELATQTHKLPSETLVLEPFISNVSGLNDYSDLLSRLESHQAEIIEFITEIIPDAEKSISPHKKKIYKVPEFEDKLSFELSKPFRIKSHNVLWRPLLEREVFYTQEEYKKFGDLICNPKTLNQLIAGMINVLLITTDSETHDDVDLTIQAIPKLQRFIAKDEDEFFIKKGFREGIEGFLNQYRKISAIAFVNSLGTENGAILLKNNNAECQLPEDVEKVLLASICRPTTKL
ncbi:MAG: hypothetical protein H6633_20310 [Anaerolineales bacterium]|nr:hypothetical protein [Anaerolineales bacterium]